MADDLTEKEIEEHTARNAAGEIIGVTCLECNRILTGEKPRLCPECAAEARSSARRSNAKDND